MKRLPWTYPAILLRLDSQKFPEVYAALRGLVSALEKFRKETATVVNFNSVDFTASNGQPTDLQNGEMRVWKDTDAAGGSPTHYLLYKDSNGDVVSFASEETA